MAQRGVEVSYESIRTWCEKFGRRDKGANNRAENSHQPTRQRERKMKRFKSAAQAQRFLSIFSEVGNLFALARHTLSAANHRFLLHKSLGTWSDLTQAGVVH